MHTLRVRTLYLRLAGVGLLCWVFFLFPARSKAQEPFHLSVLGQVGGVGHAAAWAGQHLYAGIGPRLAVWDAADMDHPVEQGQSALLPGIVRDIVLAGEYAFVALDPFGLGVLSLEDPARPTWVGGWESPAPAVALAYQPPYLFLAMGPAGIAVLDMSVPAVPVDAAQLHVAGTANDVDVCGGSLLAVAAGQAGGLRLWDVQDMEVPAELGNMDTPGDANAVACAGGLAWVADGLPGLLGISIENPSAPAEIGRYNSPGDARHVVLRGELAYLADGWMGGLSIISLVDPAHPSRLSRLDTDGLALAVALGDGRAAVMDGPLPGIQLVDVVSAAAPARRGVIAAPGYAWDVDAAGGVAYVANGLGGLWTVSLADPRHPVPLASLQAGPASLDEWARKMGIISPANAALGELRTGANALGVKVLGNRAYMADGWAGLRVISVADPAEPQLLGSADTPGNAQAVDVAGEFAYTADGSGGMRVI
ncbi:MAG: LVIVD repeat-containing protein, partial [Anaerolineae bacterium]